MSWLRDSVELVTSALIPPSTYPEDLRRYRVRVAWVALIALLISLTTWPIALGMVPYVFGGFAREDSLIKDRQISDEHWSNETADSLLQMTQRRCSLPVGSELRTMYDTLIERRMEEYRTLTGRNYPLPSCQDL